MMWNRRRHVYDIFLEKEEDVLSHEKKKHNYVQMKNTQ